jgi:hypothetical protein
MTRRISPEKRNEYQRKYREKKKKQKKQHTIGFTEVSTETLEEIALELINKDHADKTALNLLLEVWKYKHKIPAEVKKDSNTTNAILGLLASRADPPPNL